MEETKHSHEKHDHASHSESHHESHTHKAKSINQSQMLLIGFIVFVVTGILYFAVSRKVQPLLENTTATEEEEHEDEAHEGYEEPVEHPVIVIESHTNSFPITTTIKRESIVAFKNIDTIEHSLSEEIENGFDTGVIQPQASINVKEYEDVGTYTYHCSLHPDEKGTIIVEE